MHLYNDNDPASCNWLEELIKQNHLPYGHICSTSITNLQPSALTPYTQVHLFAGIGGWPYALRLAGWPDDMPVWTGSCPCQPFSCAGKQLGTADPRHLWPHMLRLITECRPPVVFGEQVAGKVGREWLSGIRYDLETLGYAVGTSDLCATSAGAPHIRQRLFWMAYTNCSRLEIDRIKSTWQERKTVERSGKTCTLDNPSSDRCHMWSSLHSKLHRQRLSEGCKPSFWSSYDLIPCRDNKTRRIEPGSFPLAHGVPARMVRLCGYGNAIVPQVAAEFIAASVEAINDCYL